MAVKPNTPTIARPAIRPTFDFAGTGVAEVAADSEAVGEAVLEADLDGLGGAV